MAHGSFASEPPAAFRTAATVSLCSDVRRPSYPGLNKRRFACVLDSAASSADPTTSFTSSSSSSSTDTDRRRLKLRRNSVVGAASAADVTTDAAMERVCGSDSPVDYFPSSPGVETIRPPVLPAVRARPLKVPTLPMGLASILGGVAAPVAPPRAAAAAAAAPAAPAPAAAASADAEDDELMIDDELASFDCALEHVRELFFRDPRCRLVRDIKKHVRSGTVALPPSIYRPKGGCGGPGALSSWAGPALPPCLSALLHRGSTAGAGAAAGAAPASCCPLCSPSASPSYALFGSASRSHSMTSSSPLYSEASSRCPSASSEEFSPAAPTPLAAHN